MFVSISITRVACYKQASDFGASASLISDFSIQHGATARIKTQQNLSANSLPEDNLYSLTDEFRVLYTLQTQYNGPPHAIQPGLLGGLPLRAGCYPPFSSRYLNPQQQSNPHPRRESRCHAPTRNQHLSSRNRVVSHPDRYRTGRYQLPLQPL
jgi:hypothetical protein